MTDRLPYTLTKGVTATREGLVIVDDESSSVYNMTGDWPCVGTYANGGGDEASLYMWPVVSERLRYRAGEPWCCIERDTDGEYPDDETLVCANWERLLNTTRALHRLAAILCDDAEAFRVLHWCVTQLGGQR